MFKFNHVARGVALALALVTGSVNAGGPMAGGASEWTQLLNNGQLVSSVSKQIATVNQLVQSYVVQYNQLQQQILSGVKIGGIGLSDVLKAKKDLENYQKSLKDLGADIESMGDMFDKRLIEAKLKKMSLPEYIKSEEQRIKNGNQTARARLDRERTVMKQVQSDIELVNDYGQKVESTVGVHQATQLLNGQMNLMLQQMTRLVSMTAEAQGSDKAEELNDAAVARELMKSRSERKNELEAEIRQRDLDTLERMKNYNQ